MGALSRIGTTAAAVTLMSSSAAAVGINTATASPGGTTIALGAAFRLCDFSRIGYAPMVPNPPVGTGLAVIRSNGSTVVAEVRLVDPDSPGEHYNVGVIQVPRPASAGCGPADPATGFAGIDLDAAGVGTVTITDNLEAGTTGVWVQVQRPHSNAQHPAEFYTSEFVAPV